jgi:hypothetical protein
LDPPGDVIGNLPDRQGTNIIENMMGTVRRVTRMASTVKTMAEAKDLAEFRWLQFVAAS